MIVREAECRDAAGIAQVHIASWRTTYRGIVSDEVLARLTVEPRERYWAGLLCGEERSQAIYVAEDAAGAIVGFADGGPERAGRLGYAGELYAIYLLQEHQRKGLGRRLTLAVARRLAEAGMPSMLVWVLANNRLGRGFYEALGGRQVAEQPVEIGGATLTEVAYGWDEAAFARLLAAR